MHEIPTRIIIFGFVQLAACTYAAAKGGAPERWVSAFMCIAAVSTVGVGYEIGVPLRSVSIPILIIDILLFTALIGLAATANRFWPIWVAAFQLVALSVHIARQLEPNSLDQAYNRMLGKLAYPMIALLVIGTARHAARSKEEGEADWSPIRW